jgi:nucleoside recognition membrane protein YjiH
MTNGEIPDSLKAKYEGPDDGSRLPLSGYVTLTAAFLILSGLLGSAQGWLNAFDFVSMSGNFGAIKGAGQSTFLGSGGTGAKQGFIFGVTLIPPIMLALGIMSIVEQTGGLRVAKRYLTPLMRPLFGMPGCTSLALIASMQSTDAGAVLTKLFYEHKEINDRERLIFAQYEVSGPAAINNYLTIGPAVFTSLVVGIGVPLLIILFMKVVGANVTRCVLLKFYPREALADREN